ncbi:hypothetical protein JN11_00900 [Mucilaginibacter frigoritolerans]|uniref:DKNYY family protein n=1 Tax=Mucilaginibacter frigoritolerans TaxID=652788 RepID=A0A562UC34_9SPHI|nr:hypothetical protein [Mucilaginibacter frigoritolerans]TWJ03362.1 hypothetical protein JN11_00900 [Mucilaginibacter frigoritolerans]
MKKFCILFSLVLVFGLSVCAAQENTWVYRPGKVIFKDGTSASGLVRIYDDAPWYNQRFIWFIDSASYAANPNVKGKKYKADDMQTYIVGTRIFNKAHYVNTEHLQLKSLGSNDHMMEQLTSGRITSYRFYDYPDDFYGDSGTQEKIEQDEAQRKNDLLKGYKILCKKDDEKKFQNAFDMDLLKYLADVPAVQQKYQTVGYGNQPVEAHKGLAAKMIAMAKKAAFKPDEADAIIAAFNDYNAASSAPAK